MSRIWSQSWSSTQFTQVWCGNLMHLVHKHWESTLRVKQETSFVQRWYFWDEQYLHTHTFWTFNDGWGRRSRHTDQTHITVPSCVCTCFLSFFVHVELCSQLVSTWPSWLRYNMIIVGEEAHRWQQCFLLSSIEAVARSHHMLNFIYISYIQLYALRWLAMLHHVYFISFNHSVLLCS